MVGAEYVNQQAAAQLAAVAERLIDRQIQVQQHVAERAHGLTRLGIAELGGITAISGYVLARGILDPIGGAAILISVLVGLAGVIVSLRSAVGSMSRRTLGIGPAVAPIRLSIKEGMNESETYMTLTTAYEEITADNNETIRMASLFLVVANYIIACSATLFFIALVYIIWRPIL